MKRILFFIMVVMALSGCHTTKYVPVEKVVDHYQIKTDTIRDSIYHDVYVTQFAKGDTIYQVKTEYLYKDRWRIKDSIVIQHDSIPTPYEVIKEVKVEKELSWWQKLRMRLGDILMVVGLLAIVVRLVYWYIHRNL